MRRLEALLIGLLLLAPVLAAALFAAPGGGIPPTATKTSARLAAATAAADPTADDLIAKYVAKIGGADKLQAIKTLKKSGKFTGGGGFEAKVVEENKRPSMVRQEFV